MSFFTSDLLSWFQRDPKEQIDEIIWIDQFRKIIIVVVFIIIMTISFITGPDFPHRKSEK